MSRMSDGLGIIGKIVIKKSIYSNPVAGETILGNDNEPPGRVVSSPTVPSETKTNEKSGYSVEDLSVAGHQERPSAMDESSLGRLFKAYFNNKMTVLIFLCSAVHHKPEEKHVNSICCFLDDIYRHMLVAPLQRQYRRKFIWLRGFFQKLPCVRTSQRAKAINLIQSLCDVFGINLKKNLGGDEK